MTFDEWLVLEHGCNHGWTFSEVDAAREAWEASAKIEREACDSRYKALEDRANSLLEAMREAQALIRNCEYVMAGSVLGVALIEHKEWEGKVD
jgi:hypothetical protein